MHTFTVNQVHWGIVKWQNYENLPKTNTLAPTIDRKTDRQTHRHTNKQGQTVRDGQTDNSKLNELIKDS